MLVIAEAFELLAGGVKLNHTDNIAEHDKFAIKVFTHVGTAVLTEWVATASIKLVSL